MSGMSCRCERVQKRGLAFTKRKKPVDGFDMIQQQKQDIVQG